MKKKILIAIIILLITITIVLGVILIMQKRNVKSDTSLQLVEYIEPQEKNTQKVEKVRSATAYFTVKSCAEKYINYIVSGDLDIVYNLLDDEYIKTFHITKDNIKSYIDIVYEDSVLEVQNMYVQSIDDNNQVYYLKGILSEITDGEEIIYGDSKEFIVTININHENMTFTVIPFGYGGVFYE